jgi:hypothetical protein
VKYRGLQIAFALGITLVLSLNALAQEYNEAPMLAEMVEAGELPPVEERLPEPERPIVWQGDLAVLPQHMAAEGELRFDAILGYNALVDRFGRIYAGRAGGLGRSVIGAHAQGFNAQTTGVAALGTHTRRAMNVEMIRAFGRFLAWKLPHHGTRIRGTTTLESAGGSMARFPRGTKVSVPRVFPHRRVNHTACPGAEGRKALKRIRNRAHNRMINHQ